MAPPAVRPVALFNSLSNLGRFDRDGGKARHFSLLVATMRLEMAEKWTRFPDRLATNP